MNKTRSYRFVFEVGGKVVDEKGERYSSDDVAEEMVWAFVLKLVKDNPNNPCSVTCYDLEENLVQRYTSFDVKEHFVKLRSTEDRMLPPSAYRLYLVLAESPKVEEVSLDVLGVYKVSAGRDGSIVVRLGGRIASEVGALRLRTLVEGLRIPEGEAKRIIEELRIAALGIPIFRDSQLEWADRQLALK